MPAPKQTDPQFKLRMPQEVKDGLDRAVARSARSLNAEIVARLEQSLLLNLPPIPPELVERMQAAPADLLARAEHNIGLNMLEVLNEYFPAPPRSPTAEDVLRLIGGLVERMSAEEAEAAKATLAGGWSQIAERARQEWMKSQLAYVESSASRIFGPGKFAPTRKAEADDEQAAPLGSSPTDAPTDGPQGRQRAYMDIEKQGSGSRSKPTRKLSGPAVAKPKR